MGDREGGIINSCNGKEAGTRRVMKEGKGGWTTAIINCCLWSQINPFRTAVRPDFRGGLNMSSKRDCGSETVNPDNGATGRESTREEMVEPLSR